MKMNFSEDLGSEDKRIEQRSENGVDGQGQNDEAGRREERREIARRRSWSASIPLRAVQLASPSSGACVLCSLASSSEPFHYHHRRWRSGEREQRMARTREGVRMPGGRARARAGASGAEGRWKGGIRRAQRQVD